MKTYRATVKRSGKYWAIRVAGVGPTQARHLREVDEMVEDLISVMTGESVGSFEVEYDYRLPEVACEHIKRAKRLRAEAERAQSAAAEEVRAAARKLSEDGIALRDIGKLLGISHQRAHQLVN